MRTKKKTWAPPAFPLRNQLFRDAPGTWRIDQFSQALFPSLKQETAVYRPRLAVFEAYEFARGRAGDAARLAEACAELRPGLLSLISAWKRISGPVTRANKELQGFPITAVWWDFELWESEQPQQLSPLMSAGRRTRQLIKFMSELESLKEELRAIGQGRPRAAFEYGFVYSLAKWWREITRHLPSGSRGTSLLGQMFSNFVEAARKDAQIPGAASLNSAIKVVVRAMKGRRSSRQKTTV